MRVVKQEALLHVLLCWALRCPPSTLELLLDQGLSD